MIKITRLILILCFVLAFISLDFSSVLAENTALPDSVTIGPFPGGPGGRDVPIEPPSRPEPLLPFYNPDLPVQKRVDDLVSRLELEEKVALMQMAAPAIPRLGIAPYHWWSEALHGMTHDLSTVVPQAIGLAATWDTNLHFEVATAISTEGRAKNREYREKNIFSAMTGLDFWSPNINIFRDPRWGRGQESYGEDPYLSGRFGIAFVKGIQGDHPFYFKAIATPKHFAVHSGPESIREQFNAVVTDMDLYTTYLPQFEAAVKEGHAYSFMSSYNAVNGVPAPANKRLLTDILRDQWGFDGYVVSDVGGVADIYQQNRHAYVQTAIEASALAVKAGNELNSGTVYAGRSQGGGASNLAQAIDQGLITIEEVNTALGNLMEARIRMGEFDPPDYAGNPYNKITAAMYNTPEHHELALKAARKTMVLLKNEKNTLPLKTDLGTVAVLGPNADSINMQYGNYNGEAPEEHQLTILDGIKKAVGADNVITPNQKIPLVGTIALTELVNPKYLFTDISRSKNGLTVAYATTIEDLAQPSKTDVCESGALMMPAPESGISFDPALAVKMTGVLVPPMTGEYQLGAKGRDGYRLTIDGQVLIDDMQGGGLRTAGNLIYLEKDKAYSVLVEFTHSATTGGSGAGGGMRGRGFGGTTRGMVAGGMGARGGFGRRGRGSQAFGATAESPGLTATPSADTAADPLFQIAWTKPTEDGLPANTAGESLYGEAVDIVKKSDAVVLVVGIDGSQEGEMRDRNAIELPIVQEGLIRAVTKTAGNKPVVVVCCSGSPVALNWANDNVPAILQAWYPGQRGDAVADILFGKYNPAGRLPVTFYKATADLPSFTDYVMYNRTYRYNTKPVLYPFGHGLSYSTFKYSNLVAPAKAVTDDDVKISFEIKNISRIDGDEVVQCYINRQVPAFDPASLPDPDKMSDEQATLTAMPRKTLVGFARVPLKAGQSRNVTFTVTSHQLSLVVGKNGKREVRPGNLQIQVGPSSAIGTGTLSQALLLEGSPHVPEYNYVSPVVK